MVFKSKDCFESVPLLHKFGPHTHLTGNYRPSSSIAGETTSINISRPFSLPEETCSSLIWRDITVFVDDTTKQAHPLFFFKGRPSQPQRYRRVLNNVSGAVNAGTLLAIMGASGSGKTTLMTALANRLPRGSIFHGNVFMNGKEGHFGGNNSSVGFVYQEDLFIETLTVKEHLTFRAVLETNSWNNFEKDISEQVNQLLNETDLLKCQDTRIGDPTSDRGLSGGERKRLALASEILTNPTLLFCDEPTTGLDSFNAQRVIALLQKMAANGKCVICSIHQPSSEVFTMFDRLLLLADGRNAFFGPTSAALGFFASLGYPSPSTYNPADYYIETLAAHPCSSQHNKEHIRKICDEFARSVHGRDLELQITFNRAYEHQSDENENIKCVCEKKAPWGTQLRILMWRGFLDLVRNPRTFGIRIGQRIFLGLIIGFLFMNVSNNQKGIMDKMGAIFLFVSEITFPTLYGVLEVFPKELLIFLRENKINMYSAGWYYLAKIIILIPGFLIEPTVFLFIAYWMIGINVSLNSFLITWLLVILTANTAAACGCCFSTMFESTSIAMTVLVPVDSILMLVAGTFINPNSLPSYISWVQYLSWFHYANEGINIAVWDGVKNITCEWSKNAPCISTGEEVLKTYGFKVENFQWSVPALFIMYGAFHLLGFVFLLRQTQQ